MEPDDRTFQSWSGTAPPADEGARTELNTIPAAGPSPEPGVVGNVAAPPFPWRRVLMSLLVAAPVLALAAWMLGVVLK